MTSEAKLAATNKRPTAITVICILGVIGALITIPMIFSPMIRQFGTWYPPFLALSTLIGLVCMVGLWQMKRWAVYTYIGMVVVSTVVLVATGLWNLFALVGPAIVIFFALRHLAEMR